MRRIIIVLVIIAALLLVSPLLTGQIAEKELKAASSRLSDQIKVVDVVEVDYQRGWFDSKTSHRFVIPAALLGADPDTDPDTGLSMHTEVMHGPVIVGGEDPNLPAFTVALAVSKTTFELEADEGEAPYAIPGAIYNRIELDGSGTLWGVFDSIDKQFDNAQGLAGSLTWGGGRFDTRYDASQTEVDATFASEPLLLESSDGSLEIGAFSGTGDWSKGPFGFWIGKTTTLLASMAISGNGQSIEVSGFEIDASSVMQGEDRLAVNLIMSIAELDLPEFSQTMVRIPVDLTGLDAGTLGQMNAMANDATGNPEDAAIKAMKMQELSLELMQRGFSVAVPGFLMESQEGNATLDFAFDVPESAQANQAALIGALIAATGNAELQMDRRLLDFFAARNPQLAQQADAMLAAGFLTEEDGVLTLDAEYEGGLLTVNGLPIPLPMPGGG